MIKALLRSRAGVPFAKQMASTSPVRRLRLPVPCYPDTDSAIFRASDIDLVVLSDAPLGLLNGDWVAVFGEVESSAMAEYGELKSLRVFYRNGPEVEFGVAGRAWAQTPLDSGTRNVLAGGIQVLYDPEGVFRVATDAVRSPNRQLQGTVTI